MIDRQGGRILLECDSCDEIFEGEIGDEWSTVWPQAQRDGRKSRKIGKEWVHSCQRCGS